MSLVKNAAEKTEEILNYLRNHPEFFTQHPEILSELNIPHETGNNISSLIEYQVARLRDQSAELKQTIHAFEEDDKLKRSLAKQIYDLSITLLQADDHRILFDVLNKGLKKYYAADQVLLLIFKKLNTKEDYSGLQFLEPDSKLKFMFTEIFHRKKPLCGSLQEEHIAALFKENHNRIHATLLIPFQQSQWDGLLVLGGREHNCYSHGFELDLLVYLCQILGIVIDSWI